MKSIIKSGLGLLLGFGLVSSFASTATALNFFTAADFSATVLPQQPFYLPGQLIVFDAILYNHSSRSANFGLGGNVSLTGWSTEPEIDGVHLHDSLYISAVNYPSYVYQTIAPGGNLRFEFMTVMTVPSVPMGSVVTPGTGNWTFQNVPRSSADPYVDFYIPQSPISAIVAVPEPGTSSLVSLSLLILAASRLRRRHNQQIGCRQVRGP